MLPCQGSAVGDTTSRYYEFITLTTQEVQAAVRHAKSLGLKVMLKPHVDLLRDNKPLGRFWRGDIGGCPASWDPPPVGVIPFTAAEWDAWFTSYKAAFLPYAQLAEAELVSIACAFTCIGARISSQQHGQHNFRETLGGSSANIDPAPGIFAAGHSCCLYR